MPNRSLIFYRQAGGDEKMMLTKGFAKINFHFLKKIEEGHRRKRSNPEQRSLTYFVQVKAPGHEKTNNHRNIRAKLRIHSLTSSDKETTSNPLLITVERSNKNIVVLT